MVGSECQALCQNYERCTYFTHYNEGHEGEHGHCYLFTKCAWPEEGRCHNSCQTHEVFDTEEENDNDNDMAMTMEEDLDSAEKFGGEVDVVPPPPPPPGHRWCHCMRGPKYPDVDACDLWP